MATLLKGAPVSAAINRRSIERAEDLKQRGIIPTLAILRVGERPDDLSYERGAMKKAAAAGVNVKNVILDEDVDSNLFFDTLTSLNQDPLVHGILMFRPLPKHLDEKKACELLAPEKDVDGCTDGSLAGVFTNSARGFAPCTAQAAMEILHYYDIDVAGKKAVVIGRSLVVGRPLAMMLMHENATVTICHTKTRDIPAIAREADILIAASGQMESINAEYCREGQIIIDVGIGWNEAKQKLCGDVVFDEAESVVSAITPVPGGVGVVTSTVLMSHVIDAAEKSLNQ